MEYFCKEIKGQACVDFEKEELQDIMKAVYILMNRFVGEFNTKYPDIEIERLQHCGSMAEKTRIWERSSPFFVLEFDYLAVVKSLPSYGDFIFEHNLDGEIEVKYKTIDSESSGSEYFNLNWDVMFTLGNTFYKCITKKCERNLCDLRLKDNAISDIRQLNGCPLCAVYMKSGSLKCISTLKKLQGLQKIRFMWASKDKPLRTSHVGECVGTFLQSFNANCNGAYIQATSDKDVRPLHWVDENASEVDIEVDFHPVLKLDVAKIVQKTRRLHCLYNRKNVILCPPNVYGEYKAWWTAMNQTQLKNPRQHYNKIKYFNLAHFIINLLNVWKVKVSPELDNNETYFLFPKSQRNPCHKCWRLSTCLNELDILDKTSQEHRDAFRVLKFLITPLNNGRVFPTIGNYEAKMAVIKHIKECNKPNKGAHVCVLNILHDIALRKEGSASMDHPILHLDLYETLQPSYHCNSSVMTQLSICLKILILILVQNRLAYTITDFYYDIISIKLLYDTIYHEQYTCVSYLPTEFDTGTDLYNQLRELVTRRKVRTSIDEVKRVLTFLQRRSRLRDLQDCILQEKLSDLHSIEYMY